VSEHLPDFPGLPEGEPWRLRYFTIWTGQSLSLFGSSLTQFILVWWIAQTTGSASSLATAGIAALLPQGLLGPFAGVVADRYSRRAIMIGSDTIAALCVVVLAMLFATERIELWHIYGLLAIRSAMQAFQSPAAAASTSMLVPRDWLTRAAGLNQLVYGLMSVTAAPLAAVALAWLPLQWALLIDVTTAALGVFPLLVFRIPQFRTAVEARVGIWDDMRAGMRVVFGHRGLRMLYGLNALMLLTIVPTYSLMPLLVQQYFNGGINEIALMEGAGGLGMILGGLVVSLVAIRRRMVVVLISYAVACATVALAALTPATAFWLAIVWWCVSGITYVIADAPLRAVLQTVVPNEFQGRVLSLFMLLWAAVGPLGLLLFGPLGDAYGIRTVFVGAGIVATLICLLGFLSRSLVQIEAAPPSVPGVAPAIPGPAPQPATDPLAGR
jgi:DHA3 family macrolide efflux protein-like MFS transporter